MSVFRGETLSCPACGADVKFNVNFSLNADRRPDFRQQILDGTFQRATCPACNFAFRLDPEMTYLHVKGGLYVLVRPVDSLPEWPALEEQAEEAFALGYGEATPLPVQEIGRSLKLRVTFGWQALREKILAAEKGIDDVALELMKLALLRTLGAPLADDTELRYVGDDDEGLVLAWLQVPSGQVVETTTVPRDLLNSVTAGPEWQPVREELTAGPFVDLNRLFVEPAETAEATA